MFFVIDFIVLLGPISYTKIDTLLKVTCESLLLNKKALERHVIL